MALVAGVRVCGRALSGLVSAGECPVSVLGTLSVTKAVTSIKQLALGRLRLRLQRDGAPHLEALIRLQVRRIWETCLPNDFYDKVIALLVGFKTMGLLGCYSVVFIPTGPGHTLMVYYSPDTAQFTNCIAIHVPF